MLFRRTTGSDRMYLSPEPVAAPQGRWRTEELDTETHCSDLQNEQRQKKKKRERKSAEKTDVCQPECSSFGRRQTDGHIMLCR